MKVTPFKEPFQYLILDDVFTENELYWIWKELEMLNQPHIMLPAEHTASAEGPEGVLLKRNRGVFLDHLYSGNRLYSPILTTTRKVFKKEYFNQPELWFFEHYNPSQDFTLVSYYESGDSYKPHRDTAIATCLIWLYQEPKKFSGGNLMFPKFDLEVECRSNTGIIFPSQLQHEVPTVLMDARDMNQGLGRYTITLFTQYAY